MQVKARISAMRTEALSMCNTQVGSPVSALKMTQLTCHMLVKSLAAECITVCALHFAM